MPNIATNRTIALARLLGWLHLAFGLLLLAALIGIWPASQEQEAMEREFPFLRWIVTLNQGQRLLAIVILSGMVGSFVHSANSFIAFAGNMRLKWEWIWFYLLRPLFGGMLAAGFYMVVRGGLLTVDGNTDSLNVFGIAAISFLVGMNSDKASLKLGEVFDTMFPVKDDRGGKLISGLTIASVEPTVVAVNTATNITIKGSGFATNVLLLLGNQPHAVTRVSETELTVALTAAETAAAGKLELVVVNPPPKGRVSEPISLTVQ